MSDRNDPQNKKDPQNKIDRVHEKLDEFASKASGPDVAYGSTPGYDEKPTEDELKKAAEAEGVTLHRRPDGSHEAIDESAATPTSDAEDSERSDTSREA
ncbi:hypothetical protein [Brevibacterium spongiae]|uniref:Uncharacterized protein n=1 Tax=Brevibacterium spongiae TaxID=2909672 RepID=A0ABY5SW81_9MICO|nr:hypothetical protein [Brevibacterium spongiae]UVI37351.1 hypothetical protein L1F31_06805 [Brevibacterium spongiae]